MHGTTNKVFQLKAKKQPKTKKITLHISNNKEKKSINNNMTLSDEVQTRTKRNLPNTQLKKTYLHSSKLRSNPFYSLFKPVSKLLPSSACPQSFIQS